MLEIKDEGMFLVFCAENNYSAICFSSAGVFQLKDLTVDSK